MMAYPGRMGKIRSVGFSRMTIIPQLLGGTLAKIVWLDQERIVAMAARPRLDRQLKQTLAVGIVERVVLCQHGCGKCALDPWGQKSRPQNEGLGFEPVQPTQKWLDPGGAAAQQGAGS